MSIRILSTSPLVGQALQRLGSEFSDLCIAPYGSVAWKMAINTAEAIIVLLSEPLTEADLAAAPRLKVIGTYSVGMNHLPLEACKARGIEVVNTPGVLTDATADLALALLLAVTRRVSEGEGLVRSGAWSGWAPEQLLGMGLAGKTCGILGSGPIGKAFARRVWALGMKPLFWQREKGRAVPVDYGPDVARRVPLDELLAQSQVLSLHCPLTADTRNLLDATRLGLLPRGAVVINTARGGIIDEPAAIRMLHEGHLGGIGLDVYANEPALNPEWLLTPNTVLLPHLGSATRETREAMVECLCRGIRKAMNKTS